MLTLISLPLGFTLYLNTTWGLNIGIYIHKYFSPLGYTGKIERGGGKGLINLFDFFLLLNKHFIVTNLK